MYENIYLPDTTQIETLLKCYVCPYLSSAKDVKLENRFNEVV